MFKNNDFIYIEYTARLEDTGEVIDTTNQEEAKKHNIYSPDKKYGPKLVILGEHRILEGLEEELYKLELNKEAEIKIPPKKAYGERDPTKVKIVSLGDLKRQGINPYPNAVLRLADGSYATVKSISGGRVILDLNHPYAGKTIIYNVKVVKVLEREDEKVKALLERWFGSDSVDKIKFEIEVSNNIKNFKFIIPKEYYLVEDFQLKKYMLAKDILTYVQPDATVTFIEVYDKSTISR